MTPITKQSLEELKKKARAATPGKRRWIDSYDFREHKEHQEQGLEANCENIEMGRMKLITEEYTILEEWAEYTADSGISIDLSNAKFFEAASPDVILDLIARVEGLSDGLRKAILFSECVIGKKENEINWRSLNEARAALESFGVK